MADHYVQKRTLSTGMMWKIYSADASAINTIAGDSHPFLDAKGFYDWCCKGNIKVRVVLHHWEIPCVYTITMLERVRCTIDQIKVQFPSLFLPNSKVYTSPYLWAHAGYPKQPPQSFCTYLNSLIFCVLILHALPMLFSLILINSVYGTAYQGRGYQLPPTITC